MKDGHPYATVDCATSHKLIRIRSKERPRLKINYLMGSSSPIFLVTDAGKAS